MHHPWTGPLVAALALGLGCPSSELTTPDADGDGDGDECASCTATQVCRGDRCVEESSLCETVECPEGSACYLGVCRAANPCDGVACPNPGEVCRNGRCLAGEGDLDGDGALARDDCDESDPLIHPGAEERCNGEDDNCDGLIDETFDADGDGFPGCDGTAPELVDCDDSSVRSHPAASEVCDGRDNDCDGRIDEDFDADGDGFPGCLGTAADLLDCDDTSTDTYPGATETCNGTDDDCDGEVDEVFDEDGDGFVPEGCGSGPADCDDRDDAVNPEAVEVCDGLDNDCDGEVDAIASAPLCPVCPNGAGSVVSVGALEYPGSCTAATSCDRCVYVQPEDEFYWCRSMDGGPYEYVPAQDCTPERRCEEARCEERVAYCSSEDSLWQTRDELDDEVCDGVDNDCDGVVDMVGGSTVCPDCPYGGGGVALGVSERPTDCTSSTPCDQCLYVDDLDEFYWCRALDDGPYQYYEFLHCDASNEGQVARCDDVCSLCSEGSWGLCP